jgi:adenylate cyclase
MAKPLRLVRRLTLNMPAAAFFDAASNTDRVEQSIGLPAAHFTMSREPGGRQALRADARFLGMAVHWYELPFEWVENRYWGVRRVFEGVPLKWIDYRTSITPLGRERIRVEIRATVLPTNIFGRVGAYFVFGVYTLGHMIQLYRTFETRYSQRAPTIFPPPLHPDVDARALDVRARALHARANLPSGLAARLIAHLREAPDDDVKNMRPFVLADRWGTDRMETLRAFLYATQAGLLDLHWDVLCPYCRVAKATLSNLADLSPEAHCDTCNIRYDVNFDEYVELRFTVNAAVRSVFDAVFCLAGPYQSRHIVAQFYLPPGETRSVAVPLPPGPYRWRTRQRLERGNLRIGPDGGPGPLVYRFTADGGVQGSGFRVQGSDVAGEGSDGNRPSEGLPKSKIENPKSDELAPGAEIRFENASASELLLILEKADWGNEGVSAALVTSLQEFRTMFSSQVLAPGLGVSVRNLTLLFSDLKDSTAMYERVGDSPAYARVRDHFGIMSAAIAEHNGAIVKTIGDAVMAVFSVPAEAVAAALAIQEGIARYNMAAAPEDWLCVKLGLHGGPCIAITANDLLDYFGSTVNVAARAQGASLGEDIILTETLYTDPRVRELVADLPTESFTTELRGLSQLFTLYRVIPAPVAASVGHSPS